MKQTLVIKSALITIAVAAAIAMVVFAAQPRYVGRRAGHADENYLDSKKCLACHTDHYASWARTHHGRMLADWRGDDACGISARRHVAPGRRSGACDLDCAAGRVAGDLRRGGAGAGAGTATGSGSDRVV